MNCEHLTKRFLIAQSGLAMAGASAMAAIPGYLLAQAVPLGSKRPPPAGRKFRSAALDAYIISTSQRITDPATARRPILSFLR